MRQLILQLGELSILTLDLFTRALLQVRERRFKLGAIGRRSLPIQLMLLECGLTALQLLDGFGKSALQFVHDLSRVAARNDDGPLTFLRELLFKSREVSGMIGLDPLPLDAVLFEQIGQPLSLDFDGLRRPSIEFETLPLGLLLRHRSLELALPLQRPRQSILELGELHFPLFDAQEGALPLLRECRFDLRAPRRIVGLGPVAIGLLLSQCRLQARQLRQRVGELRLQIHQAIATFALLLEHRQLLLLGERLLKPDAIGCLGLFELLPFHSGLFEQRGDAPTLDFAAFEQRGEPLVLRARMLEFGAHGLKTRPAGFLFLQHPLETSRRGRVSDGDQNRLEPVGMVSEGDSLNHGRTLGARYVDEIAFERGGPGCPDTPCEVGPAIAVLAVAGVRGTAGPAPSSVRSHRAAPTRRR